MWKYKFRFLGVYLYHCFVDIKYKFVRGLYKLWSNLFAIFRSAITNLELECRKTSYGEDNESFCHQGLGAGTCLASWNGLVHFDRPLGKVCCSFTSNLSIFSTHFFPQINMLCATLTFLKSWHKLVYNFLHCAIGTATKQNAFHFKKQKSCFFSYYYKANQPS